MRFRILGPLEVQVDGGWSGINAPKWRTVLAVLLLQANQVVSTDQLITEVWPDESPARATNLISVYVHRLRKLMGDPGGAVLVTRAPGGYQLLAGAADIDAGRFAELTAGGRQALSASDFQRAARLLGEALALWQGSRALPDVPPSALVSAEASRLEESRVDALQLRIQADLGCGRHAQVVGQLHRLLADYPLREELWALLMRALYGSGRQAEALEAYAQARGVIADELGVAPSAELQQLFEHILRADPGDGPPSSATPVPADSPFARPAAPVPPEPAPAGPGAPLPRLSQLPADIPDFTGRADHLQRLRGLLSGPGQPGSPGAVVVAAVIGAGGLGKTTLAVHAAHLLRAEYPDGQLYANLAGASQTPAAPSDVLARFLRDLGMDPARIPADEEERAAHYRSRLADQRVLIVLDDAKDAAHVRPLLPGSASCAVLVTTRNRMPDLAGSQFVDLDVLERAEATRMFAGIIGPGRAEAEPQATGDVISACAGLPLAIRIAGARLAARRNWSVRTIATRLSDERRRLDWLQTGDLAVRACFEVSFKSLPSAAADGVDPAHAFRLLGLWPGASIGLAAAAALVGQPEDAVADALEVLVDAQLLQSPGPDRYRFHDLLRSYAAERAAADEPAKDRGAAVQRVLEWYLYTVAAMARIVSPHRDQVPLGAAPGPGVSPVVFGAADEALNWCEGERGNLVAATQQAAAYGMDVVAWKLPVAALSFFNRRTYRAEWVATHRVALASARKTGDQAAVAWVLNNLGIVYAQLGMADAVGCFEQALAIRRQSHDLHGEGQAANNLANTYLLLRRFGDLDPFQQALGIQRRLGDRFGEAVALNNLGEAYRHVGRVDESISCLQQARDIFTALDDAHGEGYALHYLGQAYLQSGRIGEAVDHLTQALGAWRAGGERLGEAQTLRQLGSAQRAAQRPADARQSWLRALALFEELGDEAQAAEIRSEIAAAGH